MNNDKSNMAYCIKLIHSFSETKVATLLHLRNESFGHNGKKFSGLLLTEQSCTLVTLLTLKTIELHQFLIKQEVSVPEKCLISAVHTHEAIVPSAEDTALQSSFL